MKAAGVIIGICAAQPIVNMDRKSKWQCDFASCYSIGKLEFLISSKVAWRSPVRLDENLPQQKVSPVQYLIYNWERVWSNGTVQDSGSLDREFEPHFRQCVCV